MRAVIGRLGALEVNDVWVEAGAGLNGALLRTGLIDELIIYMAPRLLGYTARMFDVPALHALANDYRVMLGDFRILTAATPRDGPPIVPTEFTIAVLRCWA